jgi:hypothetical protein
VQVTAVKRRSILQPVFKSIRKNLDAGTLAAKLEVPPAQSGFKRLT